MLYLARPIATAILIRQPEQDHGTICEPVESPCPQPRIRSQLHLLERRLIRGAGLFNRRIVQDGGCSSPGSSATRQNSVFDRLQDKGSHWIWDDEIIKIHRQ